MTTSWRCSRRHELAQLLVLCVGLLLTSLHVVDVSMLPSRHVAQQAMSRVLATDMSQTSSCRYCGVSLQVLDQMRLPQMLPDKSAGKSHDKHRRRHQHGDDSVSSVAVDEHDMVLCRDCDVGTRTQSIMYAMFRADHDFTVSCLRNTHLRACDGMLSQMHSSHNARARELVDDLLMILQRSKDKSCDGSRCRDRCGAGGGRSSRSSSLAVDAASLHTTVDMHRASLQSYIVNAELGCAVSYFAPDLRSALSPQEVRAVCHSSKADYVAALVGIAPRDVVNTTLYMQPLWFAQQPRNSVHAVVCRGVCNKTLSWRTRVRLLVLRGYVGASPHDALRQLQQVRPATLCVVYVLAVLLVACLCALADARDAVEYDGPHARDTMAGVDAYGAAVAGCGVALGVRDDMVAATTARSNSSSNNNNSSSSRQARGMRGSRHR